jgi:hypothetical protein
MATNPALHIFPPVETVEKRQQELDALIQKSMERPPRSFQRGAGGRRTSSRSRTRTPGHEKETNKTERPSLEQPRPSLEPSFEPKENIHPQLLQPQVHIPTVTQNEPLIQKQRPPRPSMDLQHLQYQAPPEFNPAVMKTDPLPAPPFNAPGVVHSVSRSPLKRPPLRTSMSVVRSRDRVSSATGIGGINSVFSPDSASTVQSSLFSVNTMETPVTESSISSESVRSSPQPKVDEHRIQHTASLRRNAFQPPSRRPSHSESIASYIQRVPSRSSTPVVTATMTLPPPPPRENNSSRTSHRHQSSIPEYPQRTRYESSGGSTEFTDSTDSSRKNSVLTNPEDFYQLEKSPHRSLSSSYEQPAPVPAPAPAAEQEHKSIFPTYDHSLPLTQQNFYPSRPAPVPTPSPGPVEPKVESPKAEPVQPLSRYSVMSTVKELEPLWNISNGGITTQAPGPYNLKMFRPTSASFKKRNKLVFGPSEEDVFYTLNHMRPPTDADEDFPHETLIFRHHVKDESTPIPQPQQQQEDLLPIAHSQIIPPPAPSLSRTKGSDLSNIAQEAATHITTITPVLATLHALDHASKTPQAHTLALVDPKAESPAAARMAERAVKAASDRESCTLTWIRTCPRTGKYELHHPNLGVFTVVVEGDVKGAMQDSKGTRPPTSISIMNPFAQVSAGRTNIASPLASPTFSYGLARGSGIGMPRSATPSQIPISDSALLARLDFTRGLLHLDVPAIQSLGNIYLLDVCVSTLLAVAIAEGNRAGDPGLIFDAPPTALSLSKARKSNRIFGSSASKVVGSNAEANRSTVSLVLMPKRNKKDGRRGTLTVIDWTNASAVMGIEHLADSDELPRITRGILSILGVSFKTALWLLEFGVRISARMIIGLSRIAEKV